MNKSTSITKKCLSVVLAATAIFSLVSCNNNGDEPVVSKLTVKQYTQSRATAVSGDAADWVYFSFATGAEVSGINEDNRAERLDWDLAFNRFNIRTNSGLSGSGKGGALDTKSTDFTAVIQAPASGYVADAEITISGFAGGQVTPIQSTGNSVLAEGIKFSGPPPTYTINENVFIVKTADGKYAKVQFTGFHNAEGQSGHIGFRYAYQPDGSASVD